MKYIKKFNESNEIKYLKTDDSDISDFDWNKKIVNYKKILYLGSNLS